jgi:hypothetical protein
VELAIASAVILGSLIAWLQTSVEIQMHRKDGKLDFSFKLKKDKTEGKTLAAGSCRGSARASCLH